MRRVKFYEVQGVYALPGIDRFALGNIHQIMTYRKEKERVKKQQLDAIRPTFHWIFDNLTETKEVNSFDYGKNPLIVCRAGILMMFIADPDVIQDMVVTKNAQLDKTGMLAGMFQKFFGNSFLFSKTDETWKQKRKGAAFAFYKDKLIVMMETLKAYVTEAQT